METEVVIVGAGPAGTVLGYLLARSGVRTVLLEKHPTLDREFRGYFFQPLVVKLLDEMGLLGDVLALGPAKLQSFQFVDHGRRLFAVRFDDLPAPYNYGLNLAQPPLLQLLIDRARETGNFSFQSGTTVRELLRDQPDGPVLGVRTRAGGVQSEIRARLVAGADGRFSTVRRLAGVEEDGAPQRFDVVWLTVPTPAGRQYPLQIMVEDAGMLAYIPMPPDQLQLGWVIEQGTYPALRANGIEAFRRQLAAVDPALGPGLERHLTTFGQATLLPVVDSMARRWVGDGYLLLGDAAHASSPFSGQGNSLAIQDAVVAHPAIVDALRPATPAAGQGGAIPAALLEPIERRRRPSVEQVKRIQRLQARMLGLRQPAVVGLRRAIVPLVARTPLFTRMRDLIAMGAGTVRVATDRFVETAPGTQAA